MIKAIERNWAKFQFTNPYSYRLIKSNFSSVCVMISGEKISTLYFYSPVIQNNLYIYLHTEWFRYNHWIFVYLNNKMSKCTWNVIFLQNMCIVGWNSLRFYFYTFIFMIYDIICIMIKLP